VRAGKSQGGRLADRKSNIKNKNAIRRRFKLWRIRIVVSPATQKAGKLRDDVFISLWPKAEINSPARHGVALGEAGSRAVPGWQNGGMGLSFLFVGRICFAS